MLMYNLLEFSDKYSMISGSSMILQVNLLNIRQILLGRTLNNNNPLNAGVAAPLKCLSNFWRSLDLPLINCEIELDLLWSKECIISEISIIPRIPGNADANPPAQEVSRSNTNN